MSLTRFPLLKGDALLQALASTPVSIKWLHPGGRIIRFLSAAQAVVLVCSRGGGFEGRARQGRVYYIRESTGPVTERDDSFRFEMPVLRHCCDLKAASRAQYVRDPEVTRRFEDLRRREYLTRVAAIPSGLPWVGLQQGAPALAEE